MARIIQQCALLFVLALGTAVLTACAARSDNDATLAHLPPLHQAAHRGDVGAINALISAGADINAQAEERQYTPLHFAVEEKHPHAVVALIKAGADVNSREKEKYTPLHIAARKGHATLFNALVKAGADIHARGGVNKEGEDWLNTPLHIAALNDRHSIIHLLVQAGANVNAHAKRQLTPLHFAVSKGKMSAVTTLIKAGADVNAHTERQFTPLHYAAHAGDASAITALVAAGADIYARGGYNKKGEDLQHTPLFVAATEGHISAVTALIDAGADVNTQGKDLLTPLHAAALQGHVLMIDTLVRAGAHIDARNKSKITPLHYAANEGHLAVVVALVETGANVNARDNSKRTPLDFAKQKKHNDVVDALIEAGAINLPDNGEKSLSQTPESTRPESALGNFAEKSGDWRVSVYTDEMDGNVAAEAYSAYANATYPRGSRANKTRARINFECDNKKEQVYITGVTGGINGIVAVKGKDGKVEFRAAGALLINDSASARIKIDGNISKIRVSQKQDGKVLLKNAGFMRKIMSHNTILLELTLHDGEKARYRFSLRGAREAINKAREHCARKI